MIRQSFFAVCAVVLLCFSHGLSAATVTAKNDLDAARPSETIELNWADVIKAMPKADNTVTILDGAGKPLVSQMIDLDGDGTPDQFVFQSDFAPSESKIFTIQKNATTQPVVVEKVFGRHVPERYDDFAWENDRIAFRVYGPALEKVEPAGSGVDVWGKRTRNLIVNKWYGIAEPNDKNYYHLDHGEGLDCYKVGHGRGCGGDAVWIDGKMYDSGDKGWRTWKILANGPIRLVFELSYDPFDANGHHVVESKQCTLDAGSNLNQWTDNFSTLDKQPDTQLQIAIGLSKHGKPNGSSATHKEIGVIRYWDAGDVEKQDPNQDNGNIGTGVVIDPAQVVDAGEDKDNVLLMTKTISNQPITFWAGAGWDKSGDFKGVEEWDAYLALAAKRMALPLKVMIEP